MLDERHANSTSIDAAHDTCMHFIAGEHRPSEREPTRHQANRSCPSRGLLAFVDRLAPEHDREVRLDGPYLRGAVKRLDTPAIDVVPEREASATAERGELPWQIVPYLGRS